MDDKFDIRLTIASRSYSLNIDRSKEELFRRAEREINRWVATLESQYRSDNEGYLAMVALQLALQNVELNSSRSLGEDIDALKELDRLIDRQLNKL